MLVPEIKLHVYILKRVYIDNTVKIKINMCDMHIL